MLNDISIKAFASGLLDSNDGVRDICQRALSDVPNELKSVAASAVVAYIAMPDILLRNLAGDILIKLGAASVSSLLPFLKSHDHDVRKFACDILGLIANSDITNYITPLLLDTDKNVQLAAVEALGNLHAQESLDQLIMTYENFDEVKPWVIEAIGKIGGANSESYLLERLDEETDQFLQIAIIDALAFNAETIDISYKLMSKIADTHPEMQKIMLMTSFAISFRLGVELKIPDDLRHIAHRAIYEKDVNISTAALIALGDKYYKEDIDALIEIISRGNPDLMRTIMCHLVVKSDVQVISEFTNKFIEWENTTNSSSDFFDNLIFCWQNVPNENRDPVVGALLDSFEFTGSNTILGILSGLIAQDTNGYVYDKLFEYSLQASEENKSKIEPLLLAAY